MLVGLAAAAGTAQSEIACGRTLDDVLSPGHVLRRGRRRVARGASAASRSPGRCRTCRRRPPHARAAPAARQRPPDAPRRPPARATGSRRRAAARRRDGDRAGPRLPLLARRRGRRSASTLTASFDATLALRKACARRAPAGGVGARVRGGRRRKRTVRIERTLEAGTYWVVVDGQSPNEQGPFAPGATARQRPGDDALAGASSSSSATTSSTPASRRARRSRRRCRVRSTWREQAAGHRRQLEPFEVLARDGERRATLAASHRPLAPRSAASGGGGTVGRRDGGSVSMRTRESLSRANVRPDRTAGGPSAARRRRSTCVRGVAAHPAGFQR